MSCRVYGFPADTAAALLVSRWWRGNLFGSQRKGEFKEDNFSKAMGQLQANAGEDPADALGGKGKKGKTKKGGEKEGASSINCFNLRRITLFP